MPETAVLLWFTCLSHGQWASLSLPLTAGLGIKRLETQILRVQLNAFFQGLLYSKHDSDLQTGGGKTLSLPSRNVVRLCGERGKYNTVWNPKHENKCPQNVTVCWQSSLLTSRNKASNETSWSTGFSCRWWRKWAGEVHRKRYAAWGGIRSGRCFCKIHLVAAGGTGWEWGHQV